MRFIAVTKALHASVGSLAISAAAFGLNADRARLLWFREEDEEEDEDVVPALEPRLLDALACGRANESGRSMAMHSMREIICCVCGITNKRESLPMDESKSNTM
jgi:hypothetical protein